MKKTLKQTRRAFTLVEALVAIGIIGMLLGIFMTLFVPVKTMLTAALSRERAEEIITVLRAEMSQLRPNENASSGASQSAPGQYLTTFDKSFYWLRGSSRPYTSIVIFSYMADISKNRRADGTYPPVPRGKKISPENMDLVTIACPLNSSLHRDSIRLSEGPVYLVRMTQLIEKGNGEYRVAASPGVIANASSPEQFVSDPEDEEAWGGAVLYRAEFFRLFPKDPNRYRTRTWGQFEKPLFEANLSFRR